jgi:hypothetical protein
MDAEQPTDGRVRQPSESVIVGQFAGIKNTATPERLGANDLERAVNVDIDNEGQVRRRRGYRRLLTGDFHSVWTAPDGRTFVVRDGQLVLLRPDLTTVPLAAGGRHPISYLAVGDTIYFSSRSVSGKILPDLTVAPWGQTGGDGQWLSPVVRPTDTLGEVQGRILRAPPLAEWLTHHNGRIYLAAGNVLWATEMFLYDVVDATRTFFQYEAPITGLAACGDGFYVGTTEAVYFVRGPLRELDRRTVVRTGCIPGSMIPITGDVATQAGEPALQHREGVMFMTAEGLIVGFNNGFCRNMTAGRVMFPSADRVVPMLREQDGMHHYVAVAQTGGAPISRANLGDWVDIEIVRGPRSIT